MIESEFNFRLSTAFFYEQYAVSFGCLHIFGMYSNVCGNWCGQKPQGKVLSSGDSCKAIFLI